MKLREILAVKGSEVYTIPPDASLRELAQRAEALWRSARQGPGMTTTGETTVGASGRPARQPQGWFPPGPEGGGNDSA